MNELAYEKFWYLCNERHLIYLNRIAGKLKPWSEDPIFQQWKFCNIFRQLDRQSQWLIQNVIEPHKDDNPGLLLFNIFVFRAFNLDATFNYLTNGWVSTKLNWFNKWDEELIKDKLYVLVSEGGKLTSGAYMIRGYDSKPKYMSIPEVLTEVWKRKDALAAYISKWKLLQTTVEILQQQKFWGWGPFTCYQIALDLSYTPILENPKDINTWCEFGPGAKRGLEIIYPGTKSNECLDKARSLVTEQAAWLEDYMPVMTLQDVEFALCEFQKYWRIYQGGRGKEKFSGQKS